MTDKIMMPKELTAENGAKALLIGEFHETIEVENPDYCGCGVCEWCVGYPDDRATYLQKVPISWTNIKDIYTMAVKHFGDNQRGMI